MGALPPRVARTGVCLAWLLAFASCGSDGAGGTDDGPSASIDARSDGPSTDGPTGTGTSGTLDLGFGDQGHVLTLFGGKNSAMVVQGDGKIVMAGGGQTGFFVARYLADGQLDPDFGSQGLVTTTVSNREQRARAVALQSDGKLVVAGDNRPGLPNDDFDFTLVRYLTDGSPDPSFGDGGIVTATGVIGQAFTIAIQPDGKLVVAGDVPSATDPADLRVARFKTDGKVDTDFGTLGMVTVDVAHANNCATNVIIAPDGKIIVSGDPIGSEGAPTTVMRLAATGDLDDSFGDHGTLAISMPGLRVGDGLALQADGKLVLVGHLETAVSPMTLPRFAVMRLLSGGGPDESFGDHGLVVTGFKTEGDQAHAVTIQPDGKLLVAGEVDRRNSAFGLARYDASGALDPGFGVGGKLFFEIDSFNDGAESVAIAPDGSIVLGGFAATVSRTGYGVARVRP
jgi:uncharacterized delta-60 repeat protein